MENNFFVTLHYIRNRVSSSEQRDIYYERYERRLFALFSFWLLDCFQRSELEMRANALCSRKAHVALAHLLREVLRRRYVGGDKASRATALRHAYVTWRILRHRSCPYRLQLRTKKLIILSNNKASNVEEK